MLHTTDTPYTDNATLLLRERVPLDTPIIPCWPKSLVEMQNLKQNVTCIDWSFKALCHEADDKIKYKLDKLRNGLSKFGMDVQMDSKIGDGWTNSGDGR